MVLAKIRALVHRVIAKAGGEALLQRSSSAFWAKCSDNYIAASPAYYDLREIELRKLLATLPTPMAALDQGCGDGRFSLVMAEYCVSVDAFDLSSALIKKATANAIEQCRTNVRFDVRELEAVETNSAYQLVACMGVLNVSVVADDKFARVLDRLRDLTMHMGYLLLIDTLSVTSDQVVPRRHGYVAKYRTECSYVAQIESRGFALRQETILAAWSNTLVNKMFLFRRVR